MPFLPSFCEKSWFRWLLLILLYVSFLVFGAGIFSVIESPLEREKVVSLRRFRADFLRRTSACVTDGELEAFIEQIVDANNRGVSAKNNVSFDPNWSFGQSLFFAGTILTTVGYGHVTPLSYGGKLFCIFYALVGIPLTLVMFTATVERLMILTNKLLQALRKHFGSMTSEFRIRMLHLSVVLIAVIVLVFLVPSVIFASIETNWTYLDAVYYCFISMTTIGLGDYIPGDRPEQQNRALYKFLITGYLLAGLTCMILLLEVIYEIPQLNLGIHFYLRSDLNSSLPEESGQPTEKSRLQNENPVSYSRQVDDESSTTFYEADGGH